MIYDIYAIEHNLSKRDTQLFLNTIVQDLRDNYLAENDFETGSTVVILPDLFNFKEEKEERHQTFRLFIDQLRVAALGFHYYSADSIAKQLQLNMTSRCVDQIQRFIEDKVLPLENEPIDVLSLYSALLQAVIALLKMSGNDKAHVLVLNQSWYSIINRSQYLETIREYHAIKNGDYKEWAAGLNEEQKEFLSHYYCFINVVEQINDGYQTIKAIEFHPVLVVAGSEEEVSLEKTMNDFNYSVLVDGESYEFIRTKLHLSNDFSIELNKPFHEMV